MAKKNKSKTKSALGGNQNSTSGTRTKRERAKLKSKAPSMQVVPLPSIYRRSGDEFHLRLRTTGNLTNTATNFGSYLVALTPTSISSSGYAGLADFFPLLTGIGTQYCRFMVSRLMVQVVPTTAVTNGGYVALGYQPDDSNTSSPPSALSDVTSALHSDVAQVTEIACIELNPSDYYNEWRQSTITTGLTTFDCQAGVVQVFLSNSASTATGVALIQMEVDIHFSGYRKLNA